MKTIADALDYLRRHDLMLTTAESCTAGLVISLLAEVEGAGALLDCGYVVYSPDSKRRLLGVRQETIERFNLTSEEVAREMAAGALRDSIATVAISNTGVAGPDAIDGIPAGTVCLAWAFQHAGELRLFSRTLHLPGDRQAVRHAAAEQSILSIAGQHRRLLAEAGT
jgi:PncC family amidohydrolase